MEKLSGLAVCSATHITWKNSKGKDCEGVILTPFAGKIPSKRILPKVFVRNMGMLVGANYYYLMSFIETQQQDEFGRRFVWGNGPRVETSELLECVKTFGQPEVIEVKDVIIDQTKQEHCLEKCDYPYCEMVGCIEKEKSRFEKENAYFKRRAAIRHQLGNDDME